MAMAKTLVTAAALAVAAGAANARDQIQIAGSSTVMRMLPLAVESAE